MSDSLTLARQLVAIPSVNPMGGADDGPQFYEGRVTEFLTQLLRDAGAPFLVQPVAEGRANVLARFESNPSRPTLLWDAHQDTVPVEGMIILPFEPRVEKGRLYGRGSCDVKGGLAAMLAAFLRLVRERPAGAVNVVLSCTCDEEATQLGVLELVKLWNQGAPHSILGSRPIAAIVAEPTGLDIITAHRGATRWKIRTSGRACHSSDPSQGLNAIYRMMPVVAALEEYAAGLGSRRQPHPLCGPATLSVGVIHGGQAVNIVPDRCEIEIDRRTIPGEDPLQAMEEVNEFVRSGASDSFEALPPWIAAPPLPDGENDAVAQSLLATVQSHCGPHQLRGVAYGTNASTIAAAGIPSIVFGPGSIAQAHTADEWLPIDELELAAEILFNFATRFGR